jgi:DNA-binding PadR family transcriptional regulator
MKGLPTDLEMVVLSLLLGGREMYGLEMVKKDESLGENSIYVILTRMVARGFVTARYETDEEKKTRGPKRRLYKVTGYGQQMYDARVAADRAAQREFVRGGYGKPEGAL